jgi:hypothetical protein
MGDSQDVDETIVRTGGKLSRGRSGLLVPGAGSARTLSSSAGWQEGRRSASRFCAADVTGAGVVGAERPDIVGTDKHDRDCGGVLMDDPVAYEADAPRCVPTAMARRARKSLTISDDVSHD